jgi:hypothetical protein
VTDAGEDAKVMSVFSAGRGGAIDLDDLGLKKHYSLSNAATSATTYNDLMLEVSCLGIAPMLSVSPTHNPRRNSLLSSQTLHLPTYSRGGVRTSLASTFFNHWLLRPINMMLYFLVYPFTVSPEECSEYMLHALFEGERGFYLRGRKGRIWARPSIFRPMRDGRSCGSTQWQRPRWRPGFSI